MLAPRWTVKTQVAMLQVAPTQDTRVAKLATPLGKDKLVLVKFEGEERVGQLFEFRIEALSDERDIDFDGAIGRNCSVTYSSHGQDRIWSGVLTEARWLGPQNDRFSYSLVLRPWFWLLSKTTDCRIFENKTVKEIIKQVLSDRGFTNIRDKLTENYKQIEYCVQYRETDLAFICRLMEQYGIYYFFDHAEDDHALVMADSRSSHSPAPGLATLPFIPLDGRDRRAREHVQSWVAGRRFRSGKIELKDYDYQKPSAKLLSDANASAGYSHGSMEVYDYPGKYTEQDDGDRFAKVQLEAEQALDQRRWGQGDASSLVPGSLTTLTDAIKPSENTQYLVLGATHTLYSEFYSTADGSAPEQMYEGLYEFLPADRPYRMPIETPKPFIRGIQTAKVVGKQGEEIDVDDQGRILVQFYWDRKKMQSCRVRIAQVWSGKQWGGIFIPRIDMEVVVEYLEGNPDRPMVTGTVYNGDNKVPYSLPDNKTKAGWKSDSSKGHGGYNEIVFEDKKGSEDIGVHAQKDLDVVVLNKETRTIGESFMPPMGSPSRETTLKMGDDSLTIQMGNQNINIDLGSQTITVMQMITRSSLMGVTETVIMSSVALTPASISLTSPVINLTALGMINLTAPLINLKGVVNITGPLLVSAPPIVKPPGAP